VGKTLRTIALVAGTVALVATGVGAFAVAGSKLALTAASVAKFAFLAAGTATLTSTVFFGPKTPRSQISRLNVSLDPSTGRKAVLGTTAMPLDLRYHEASGTDQEFIDYIIALAAHKVASIDEIYFEEKLAWTALGGVTATYTGYLTVTAITEGTAGNAAPVNAGTVWDASCRLTGCAYVRIRIKRSGNSKKTESPLVQGLPSRVTIIGEGAPLYDPRLDSTVPGGSGSHRANNQATWGAYAGADHYDNPALQVLWFLLGWKINGKLSVGAGVPPARLDMESFITAANICDENITLATGGTQKRYRTSGTASDEDGRMDTINTFLACMNGTLRDSGGKLTLALLKNDLADPVLDFTDGDFLGEFAWDQTGGGLAQGHNIVRGRFVDPSTQSLYQMAEYPEVTLPSPDGIERVMTFDVPFVEDGRRAQRLAKQVLQRNQFRGQLSAEFNAKALGCEVGHIVTVTLSALGFNSKPFRVISKEVRVDGRVPLALLEEDALIYQWDRDDRAPVVARTPVSYNPLLNMITQGDEAVQAIADGKVTTFYSAAAPVAEGVGDLWFDTDDNILYRWNGTSWSDDVADITSATIPRHEPADSAATFTANYQGTLDVGQLPTNIQFRRFRGSTDVSTTSTWSIVSQSGVTGGTVTVSNGVVTIPTGVSIGSTGEIVVKSARDSFEITSRIVLTRIDAAPPNTGGATGGTTVNDSTFNTVTGTSLTAISDLMTVKTGSGGQIVFSAPLSILATAADPEGTFGAIGRWRYRTVGGSFVNAGTQAEDSQPCEIFYDLELDRYFRIAGSISIGATVTGLSANTDYEVQLFAARDSAPSAKTISFGGTASATGS
jgi:hypothetical protein